MNGKILIAAFAVLAGVSIALTFEIVEGRSTCLECRATLHRRHVGGFDRSWIELHDYSHSLISREPAHAHQWRRDTCTNVRSLLSWSCLYGRQHPIASVPLQIHAGYAKAVSPAELAATLRDIDSKDGTTAQGAAKRIWDAHWNAR